MHKKLLTLVVVIILIIVAALGYVLLGNDQTAQNDSATAPTPATSSPQPNPAPDTTKPASPAPTAQTPGQYLNYSQTAVDQAEGRKLLFFYAAWCPQCRQLDASIKADGVPADTTIFKIDYDSATGLRQKYGVTIQTTIVELDQNGNELKKHVAYDDPTLPAVLKALE